MYDGINDEWFSVEEVRDHLLQWLPWLNVGVRTDLLVYCLETLQEGDETEEPSLAEKLCAIRVLDPTREVAARRPLKPERDYELRLLAGASRATVGVVYDGVELQRLAYRMLPQAECGMDTLHVWFTARVIATWDETDRRYHARVSTYGYPSIISTSGMVVAPAKDRGYYLARRFGVDAAAHAGWETGDFLQHRDPRTSEVAKGYAMQAVFYALVGDPFCDEPSCRLFNAHWQRELIGAQLSEPDYCARHERMLAGWRSRGSCTADSVT